MSLGIRSLMIAFALALVAITGSIVGAMTYLTGNEAVEDTKTTGQNGLDKCFDTGTADVELVSADLLNSMLSALASDFRDYMRTPVLIVKELTEWFAVQDPVNVYDALWLRRNLGPIIRAQMKMSYDIGVSSITVNTLPMVDKQMRNGMGTMGAQAMELMVGDKLTWIFRTLEMRVCDGANDTTCADKAGFNATSIWSGSTNESDGTIMKIPHLRHLCHIYEDDHSILDPIDGADPATRVYPDCPYVIGNSMPEMNELTDRAITGSMKGKEVDPIAPRWSPFLTLGWFLTSYCYSAWAHPDYSNMIYNNPGTPRGGYVMVSVDSGVMSVMMKNMVAKLPYIGMRLYATQRNPWNHSSTNIVVGVSEGDDNWRSENPSIGWNANPLAVDNSSHPGSNPTIMQHGAHAQKLPETYASLIRRTGSESTHETWTFHAAEQEKLYWERRLDRGMNHGEYLRVKQSWQVYSAAEREQMHDKMRDEIELWGRPKSQDGVLFWTTVQEVGDENGFLWYMVLMVPKDVIMEKIDAARVDVRTMIRSEYDKTEQKKEDNTTIMLIVIVVVIVVLMTIAVVFATFLTKPLHKLDQEMAKVAMMQIDGVSTDKSTLSKMSEVRSMQRSFFRMIKNLKEFRQFMPQSLLLDHEEDEEEVVAGTEAASQMSGRLSQRSHSRAGTNKSHSRHGKSAQHTVASSMQSSKSAAMKKFLKNTVGEGLKKKKVSYAVVNTVGFHDSTHKMQEPQIVTLHTKIIEAVLVAGETSKGILDTFSGDRLMYTFNAVRPMATHKPGAAKTLDICKEEFQKLSMGFTGACAGGEAKVGNMGGAGIRKFTFLSVQLTFAFALERLARHIGVSSVAESTYAQDLEGSFYKRVIDVIAFPKLKSKKPNIVIQEICAAKTVSEDEWMYQLEEGAQHDPNQVWNTTLGLLLQGDTAAAAEKFASEAGAIKGIPEAIVRRFSTEASAGQLVPRELMYH